MSKETRKKHLRTEHSELCLDKHGIELFVGVDVAVPTPTTEDQWNFEFSGVVIELDKENGYAVVEDGDGDCWCVEFERLEIE